MGINMGMPINIASLAITPQILSLIVEIEEFKGAWRALGTLAPDRLSALRRLKASVLRPELKDVSSLTAMLSGCCPILKSSNSQPATNRKWRNLRRTQGTIRSEAPAWKPWIIYFLQSLRQQKSRLEAKIKRERLMVERLPELCVQILELANAHGRITNSQVMDMTGANLNTVKKLLQMLVLDNHLVQHGRGKATYYSRV